MCFDAGGRHSVTECLHESCLSHHQEQASSDTCSRFVHQHMHPERERDCRLPERPDPPDVSQGAREDERLFQWIHKCCFIKRRKVYGVSAQGKSLQQ